MKRKFKHIGIVKGMITRSERRIYKYELRLQEERKTLKRLKAALHEIDKVLENINL